MPSIDVPDVTTDLGDCTTHQHHTKPTHPTHASLHISLNVCHVTSHHTPHPTHVFPCIPNHIPQCLSCNFTPPTPPTHSYASIHISPNVCHVTSHHPPPHYPCLPMHPYTYPPMFVMFLHTTHPIPPTPSHTYPPMFVMLLHTTHPTPHQQPTPSHASLPYPT